MRFRAPRNPRNLSWFEGVLPIAVPVIFVVASIGPALFGFSTLLSVNLITGHMPWQAVTGWDAPGHQYCSTDTIDASVPGIAYIRSTLYAGHLPNWQSLISGGSPIGSVPSLGLLDPLSLPYFVMPLWLAPAFVKLLEFIVSIGGTFLFLRRLGRSRLASSVAGVIFASSGFMVMWTNWPQTRVAALIPALFWTIERLVQRRKWVDAGWIALVVASMFFGGFPAVTGFALYAAGPYLVVRLLARYRRDLPTIGKAASLAIIGLALGAALGAVQLLPFLSQLNNTDLEYRRQYSSVRLPFSGLLTLIDPYANGSCINAEIHGSTNPVELIVFVGSAAMVLAVIATAALFGRRASGTDRGVRTFFIGAVVVMILLGWVGGTLLGAFQNLPVFSNNFVGRIRSVFGFALAVLAAFGLDVVLQPLRETGGGASRLVVKRSSARVGRMITPAWFAFSIAVVIVVGLVVVLDAHREGVRGHYWGDTRSTLLIPGLLVIATIVALAVARSRVRWLRIAAFIVIPALVVSQSVAFFRGVIPGDQTDDFYPVTGTHDFLLANVGHDRYDAAGGTMYPATSLYYGLRAATGHQFIESGWAELLRAVDPKVRQSPTNYEFSANVTPSTVGVSPILDRIGVKYFAFGPSQLTGTVQPAQTPTGSVTVARDGEATCTVPAGSLRGVSFTVDSAITAASSPGIVADVTMDAGGTSVSSGRYLAKSVAAGTGIAVAVAGEDLPAAGSATVHIRFQGASGPVLLGARSGTVSCGVVRPADDRLKLVYADSGSIVYQRLTVLPRIRWASSSVVADPATQVPQLRAGVPDDEVVLNFPAGHGDGLPAQVSVVNDAGGQITASVDASGSGYLTVADAMQLAGWSVTVDGSPAALLPADHAMVAVQLPKGRHIVRFRYDAPGQKVGFLVSIVAGLAIIAIFVLDRRRSRHKNPDVGPEPEVPSETGDSRDAPSSNQLSVRG